MPVSDGASGAAL